MQSVPSHKVEKEVIDRETVYDISVSIHDSMLTWPGLPRVDVHKFSDLCKGDDKNITHISFCAHTGTHIDAPRHLLKKGTTISDMPLHITNGPAKVIQIKNPYHITLEEIKNYPIRAGDRILFKTKNSEEDYTTRSFKEDFIGLNRNAAEYLGAKKIRCVGIDYISISNRSKGRSVKEVLFNNDIWIINGLCFKDVNPGLYQLSCLPLKIECADGAPARAVLLPY